MPAAVAAFQASPCPVAGSKDSAQGSTCPSPAGTKHLVGLSLPSHLKIIPSIEAEAKPPAVCGLDSCRGWHCSGTPVSVPRALAWRPSCLASSACPASPPAPHLHVSRKHGSVLPGCPHLDGVFLDQIISQPGLEQTEGGAVEGKKGETWSWVYCNPTVALFIPSPWHTLHSCFPSLQG